MNFVEPSSEARALARGYINRTLLRFGGRGGPAKVQPPRSPAQKAERDAVDAYAETFSRPGTTGSVADAGKHSFGNPVVEVPNTMSDYLQNRLEVDQGVGETAEPSATLEDMQHRIELEKARLEALRETRRQVDQRNQTAARTQRQAARLFNTAHNLHQRSVPRENATRTARSTALSAMLERERLLLKKAREEGRNSATSRTEHTGAIGMVSAAIVAPPISRRTRSTRKSPTEIARMLEEQRAMLAKERAVARST